LFSGQYYEINTKNHRPAVGIISSAMAGIIYSALGGIICSATGGIISPLLSNSVRETLSDGKAVVLLGPRQVGKSTLMDIIFSGNDNVKWFTGVLLEFSPNKT